MAPTTIRPKRVQLDAWQWNPADVADSAALIEWVGTSGSDCIPEVWSNGAVVLVLGDDDQIAEPGWWVVRGVTGRFFPVSDEDYRNIYEEISR